MNPRIRAASLALLAAATVAFAPVASTGTANAAIVSHVVFFSNADYTNVDVQDASQIAALQSSGVTVTTFDGGDGSAAAWGAAIAGKQAVVVPYGGHIYNTAALSADAAAVLKQFVNTGGVLLLSTEQHPDLLSYLTGVDYTSVWWTEGSVGDTWPYSLPDPAFPSELKYTDEINAVDTSQWSDAQLEAALPVYFNDDTESGAILGFLVGTGYVYTLGYDWYPGTDDNDVANRGAWNTAQRLLIPEVYGAGPELENAPKPNLAATGATNIWQAGLAAAMLIAGLIALTVTARRRTNG